MWIIYIVVNNRNFKVYVGQTKQLLRDRWIGHKSNGKALYSAIKKYGESSFSIQVLDLAFSQEEANAKEEFYIKKHRATTTKLGYNCFDKVNQISTCRKGVKFSEEHKKKISDSMTKERKKFLLTFNVKEWVVFTPSGEKLEMTNLNKFCNDNGLDPAGMIKLTTFKKGSYYRGWQVFKKEDFSEDKVLPFGTPFLFPDGRIKRVHNFTVFAKENGFDISSICKLAKGKINHYKGIKILKNQESQSQSSSSASSA